ncbi:hypothetical protein - conserved [Leishmania donovani]|uniref:Uncharacterized protein n=2 Tax=Leishmania donovani species complex TaxID=38574 RepID=A4HSN5_LEIIN|nr:conserved hypothetical protein [Leishmania infantum JPCM5]CAJ1986085.1 hypothetical protein - conserved [Leishmania donovani]CAM65423.1 conserved hypothetical protein [Leishmania infantum JPCM5]VDZ41986.1 hypothetical_protein_conserved [Leishmania donovani]|eukprot:XP_001463076.1 conserved hypothetical protein [Leishmania infantum JPCM5]
MKSFFSKITSMLKTRRTPLAPCDCSDFIEAAPAQPSLTHLRGVVAARHFHGAPPPASDVEKARRDFVVRSTVFDLQYRCGAGGRCTCAGAPTCRFPQCFTMRPVTKGAEVLAERQVYEVEDAPAPEIRALVALAAEEKLEEVVKGIQHTVDAHLKAGARGRGLEARFIIDGSDGHEFTPATPKTGTDSIHAGANPLREDEDLREEITSLYLWRAALLVNLRRDEQAVSSLLNLAFAVEQKDRTRLYGAAAAWAVLNDMEIIYYRSLVKSCKPFDQAVHFATERPLLLARVFEATRGDDYHTDYCTHVVFSKEVTATVTRAQTAQMHGDFTEDPMRSLCLPLTMPYYRFRVDEEFWKRFYALLCMPPVPPPTPEEAKAQAIDPAAELGLTPNYILDAVGRSMMLHHLVTFADVRDKEIDTGVVVDRVKEMKLLDLQPHPSDYAPVLTTSEMHVAVTRMKELLVVVRSFEAKEQERLSGAAAAQRLQRAQSSNDAPNPSAAPPAPSPIEK